jgi:hypothetical protein
VHPIEEKDGINAREVPRFAKDGANGAVARAEPDESDTPEGRGSPR